MEMVEDDRASDRKKKEKINRAPPKEHQKKIFSLFFKRLKKLNWGGSNFFAGSLQKIWQCTNSQRNMQERCKRLDESRTREVCKKLAIAVDEHHGPKQLVDEIFGSKVEANLYCNHLHSQTIPIEMTPLAKKAPHLARNW